jgi:hypothetical protein
MSAATERAAAGVFAAAVGACALGVLGAVAVLVREVLR